MAEAKRKLQIVLGSVRRLAKELTMYEKERDQAAAKVEKLKAAGADSHEVQHAEDILAESNMMILDSKQRLTSALQDLSRIQGETKSEIGNSEEWTKSATIAEEAQQLLQK